MNYKGKYLTSAFLLLASTVIVKIIGAVYKIPLTAYIGAVGRGYFAYAYNLCMPIHIVTMGAFPIALSKLVSSYNAKNRFDKVYALHKDALRLFSFVGLIGMFIIIVVALPYSLFIAGSKKAIYTIIVLAPSVLFSCMASSYRGYFEGMVNMVPTAVSQTIEALFKMVFGLLFAKLSMAFLLNQYQTTGYILSNRVYNDDEALSIIYPYTSAFAMLGVTLGSIASLCYLCAYSSYNKTELKISCDIKGVNKELIRFSFPIMVSTSVQSVFQFLDTITIKLGIDRVSVVGLRAMFEKSLSMISISNDDLSTYIYGLFSASLDFKNIVPSITMALGVSAVPVISSAFESKESKQLSSLINDAYKYSVILSIIGAGVLSFSSYELLELFYGKSSPDIVECCSQLITAFALTIPIYSLAGTAVYVAQSIGIAKKSIPSYIVSGIVRVVLNVFLVSNERLVLYGAVISGAVGYSVLAIWNIAIVSINSRTKVGIIKVIVVPFLLEITGFFVINSLIELIKFNNNLLLLLLIKIIITIGVYCILCFLCGMLNFRTFFRYFTNKKGAKFA